MNRRKESLRHTRGSGEQTLHRWAVRQSVDVDRRNRRSSTARRRRATVTTIDRKRRWRSSSGRLGGSECGHRLCHGQLLQIKGSKKRPPTGIHGRCSGSGPIVIVLGQNLRVNLSLTSFLDTLDLWVEAEEVFTDGGAGGIAGGWRTADGAPGRGQRRRRGGGGGGVSVELGRNKPSLQVQHGGSIIVIIIDDDGRLVGHGAVVAGHGGLWCAEDGL